MIDRLLQQKERTFEKSDFWPLPTMILHRINKKGLSFQKTRH